MLKARISDDQYAELSQKINEFQRVRFDVPYWFDEEPDCEYCLDCAIKENVENPSWQRDGGFDTESDTVLFCNSCKKPLSHTLTEYGAEQELIHYEEHGLDLNDELVQHTLVCISGGIPLSHQARLYKLIF